MLRIHLEGKQNFGLYIHTLLKKASKKCHTVAKVCNHMNLNKRCSKLTLWNIQVYPVFSFLILTGCCIAGLKIVYLYN